MCGKHRTPYAETNTLLARLAPTRLRPTHPSAKCNEFLALSVNTNCKSMVPGASRLARGAALLELRTKPRKESHMPELEISPDLIAQAKALGVTVAPVVKFDAQRALQNVSAQYQGKEPNFSGEESDIGCCFGESSSILSGDSEFGSFLRHFIGRKADRGFRKGLKKVGSIAKTVGKVAAIASFVVPGIGPLVGGTALAAMAAADKLMGDKNIKNAAKLVSNTKAMAALGHPEAIRGAQVLAVVSRIRQQNKVPMGKAAVPVQKVPPHVYVAHIPQVQATALAHKKLAKPPVKRIPVSVHHTPTVKVAAAVHVGVWPKVKSWWTGRDVSEFIHRVV